MSRKGFFTLTRRSLGGFTASLSELLLPADYQADKMGAIMSWRLVEAFDMTAHGPKTSTLLYQHSA